MDTLQVAGFLDHSTVNGDGFRSTIFLSGCNHHCPSCHNEIMQQFDYGDCTPLSILIERIKKNLPLIDGITLSGGDPFEQSVSLLPLLKVIKSLQLSVWVYTGYTYEELLNNPSHARLLPYIDVLVDGRYIEALKTGTLKYIGSSNQRILQLTGGRISKLLSF
ncbi:MAG: anaerobic ribonucleoside-triphosphate reductase activating protein [Cellulosilyticaceae bacterium]